MKREELITLIKKIQTSEGTESDANRNIDILCRNVADPQAVDYIFHDNLSAEEIADKILIYKPIQLKLDKG